MLPAGIFFPSNDKRRSSGRFLSCRLQPAGA